MHAFFFATVDAGSYLGLKCHRIGETTQAIVESNVSAVNMLPVVFCQFIDYQFPSQINHLRTKHIV